ncbi:hypothetical protein L207DRAFT_516686 [Hyaloscypha variabilis F]|uniref:Chromo domain-containing protein n=1 Tax=Hyaloscypha variabilis (strain UAMH 11265 / GT02V1 / F) TaxID=1149755 RepID=A0A2J6RB39_HYAVF|nr:hypothetical protein L207DRAFT_516686 [Hyaloscypha variabilis F]
MPPQITDDEASDVSNASPAPATIKQEKKGKEKPKPKVVEEVEESLMVESEKEEDEDDDDEPVGPDEYVVESIRSHIVDEDTGELKFEVKWEGYEKASDRTWEPEENLETASKVLNEYLAKVGGKEAILAAWQEKKATAKKGKKRGRASTGTEATNGTKRGRKNGHPKDGSPPVSASKVEWKPPSGSWEEHVTHVDACEGNEGTVVVYLTWKTGQKTQHPLAAVYKRCPQQMLRFYESHLVFKKNDDAE